MLETTESWPKANQDVGDAYGTLIHVVQEGQVRLW